jgi:hypothetical protein
MPRKSGAFAFLPECLCQVVIIQHSQIFKETSLVIRVNSH